MAEEVTETVISRFIIGDIKLSQFLVSVYHNFLDYNQTCKRYIKQTHKQAQ